MMSCTSNESDEHNTGQVNHSEWFSSVVSCDPVLMNQWSGVCQMYNVWASLQFCSSVYAHGLLYQWRSADVTE